MSPRRIELRGAPEGDGYHNSGGLQWSLLCPHMGAADKILYGVLCSLLSPDNPGDVRKMTLQDLCAMLPSAPTEVGSEPKMATAATIRRQLDRLSSLGQITAPDGARLTTSSRPTADISIRIYRYPRHDCAACRNVRDALSAARGEATFYPTINGSRKAGSKMSQPRKPRRKPGSKMSQSPDPGSEVSQAGSKMGQSGSLLSAKTGSDQGFSGAPSTFSSASSSTSLSPGDSEGPDEAPAAGAPPAEREAATQEDLETAADEILDSYRSGHRRAGTRPAPRSTRRVRQGALRLLTEDSSPAMRRHLSLLASQLASKGWDDLEMHYSRNPQGAPGGSARPESQLAPWCGECGDPGAITLGAHPTTHARLRMTGEDGLTPCQRCHPKFTHQAA